MQTLLDLRFPALFVLSNLIGLHRQIKYLQSEIESCFEITYLYFMMIQFNEEEFIAIHRLLA